MWDYNTMYKLQRGTITYLMGNRTKLGDIVDFDYMGSAEFEFGAIPHAYTRMMNNYKNYKLHITDMISIYLNAPLCIFCDDRFYDYILEEVKGYIKEPYELKEFSRLNSHFQDESKWFGKPDTDFWWSIDMVRNDIDPETYDKEKERCVGDFMMFFGSKLRQEAFMECIDYSYKNWWLTLPEDMKKERLSYMYKW